MEKESQVAKRKVNPSQGPNEKKALIYLDGFTNIPDISDQELDLIEKAKIAITTGKFQQLQRDINKLRTATKKTPVKPVVLLEQLIKIISAYPLEHIQDNTGDKYTQQGKITDEFTPEIIISESFNI